jgi:hypothetical protein
MTTVLEQPSGGIDNSAALDRRNREMSGGYMGIERRQFSDSRDELSPDAGELAQAIDDYKLRHRRRFINFEEMLHVIKSLGYHK